MRDRMMDSLEHRLAALRPAPAGVGQASFYFRAGQVSRQRAMRTWQAIAGVAVALSLVALGTAGWRIQAAEARLAEAEARRPAVVVVAPVEPPTPYPPPSASAEEDLRPYSPPVAPCAPEDAPGPGEVASTLELRRSILTAGVSYLDAQPKQTRSK